MKLSGLQKQLFKGISSAFGVKLAGIGLSFVVQVILADALGDLQYGYYAYAATWLNYLIVVASLGFDKAALRQASVFYNKQQYSKFAGYVRYSIQYTLLAGIGIATVFVLVVMVPALKVEYELQRTFFAAAVAMPFFALLVLYESLLRSIKKIILAYLPQSIIRPALFIIAIALFKFGFIDAQLGAWQAMAINAGSIIIGLGFSWLLLKRFVPQLKYEADTAEHKAWRALGISMLGISVIKTGMAQVDVLSLGFFKEIGAENIGYYNAAKKIANLASFGLLAANIYIAPQISTFYHDGQMKKLEKLVVTASRFILLFTLVATLGLVVLGSWLLGLFGPSFTVAYVPLLILLGGQVVNSWAGPVALLMSMTKYTRLLIRVFFVSMLLNIVINIVLVPTYGIMGAAIGTSAITIIWNIALSIMVRRLLHIRGTAF